MERLDDEARRRLTAVDATSTICGSVAAEWPQTESCLLQDGDLRLDDLRVRAKFLPMPSTSGSQPLPPVQ